jgi:hypothetical protein
MEQLYHILTKHPWLRRRPMRVLSRNSQGVVCLEDIELGEAARMSVPQEDLLLIPNPKKAGGPAAREE